MTINLVLYAMVTKFVPGSIAGNPILVEISDQTTVRDILLEVGIPTDMRLIILVNGLAAQMDQRLHENDRMAVFPTIAGG